MGVQGAGAVVLHPTISTCTLDATPACAGACEIFTPEFLALLLGKNVLGA
jgi:hypothetical protein